MRQCPKCKAVMNFCMRYNAGNPVVIWTCSYCGYSSNNENFQTDNRTYIDENNKFRITNHT